jgi:hypothetical protein
MNHSIYLKKPYQNPLGSFKDLNIHRDRQREATLLWYTMSWLCWLWSLALIYHSFNFFDFHGIRWYFTSHCQLAVSKSEHSIEQSEFPLSAPMHAYIFKTTERISVCYFLIDRVIKEENFMYITL